MYLILKYANTYKGQLFTIYLGTAGLAALGTSLGAGFFFNKSNFSEGYFSDGLSWGRNNFMGSDSYFSGASGPRMATSAHSDLRKVQRKRLIFCFLQQWKLSFGQFQPVFIALNVMAWLIYILYLYISVFFLLSNSKVFCSLFCQHSSQVVWKFWNTIFKVWREREK